MYPIENVYSKDAYDAWQERECEKTDTDLMHRLVAEFRLVLQDGRLEGTPPIELSFLMPPPALQHPASQRCVDNPDSPRI